MRRPDQRHREPVREGRANVQETEGITDLFLTETRRVRDTARSEFFHGFSRGAVIVQRQIEGDFEFFAGKLHEPAFQDAPRYAIRLGVCPRGTSPFFGVALRALVLICSAGRST